jgi:PBP1b-binding outer membrane lipoprotein LpoB
MGYKISDLTATGSLQNTDLLEVSVDNGLGGYDSRAITGADLLAGVVMNPSSLGMTAGSPVTGTTAVTSSASIRIAANRITARSVVEVTFRGIRVTGTASTIAVSMYINTSNSLTGASLLATINTMTVSNYITGGKRSLYIDTAANQITALNAGATTGDDYVNTGSNTVLTFDETVDNFLIFAIQLTNSADTGRIQFAHATLYD